MKFKLILTMLALAGTALAQPEQWLEYHTGAQARSYHPLQVTTEAPPGVALPKLNAKPYFARWLTPMDPAGGRWLCLDRTRKSGPYDRLFIDNTGNGRLDDKAPIPATTASTVAMFPATPLIFKGADGPITYHLVFQFYQIENGPAQLMASAGGWYEGMVNFDGVKKRLQLFDANVNGTFNDVASNPFESDRVQIDGDTVGERYLGGMLEVDGKYFHIEAARDGAYVKVKKVDNVTLGPVRVPENISEVTAYGENGHFVRKPVNGEFTLPVGNYKTIRWIINRKDDKGAKWSLEGYNFPTDAPGLNVAADKPAELEIGEPVQAVLAAANTTSRDITFNLKFVGRQKEAIQMLRDNQRPTGPKLTLANADGSLCYTNTFEFG